MACDVAALVAQPLSVAKLRMTALLANVVPLSNMPATVTVSPYTRMLIQLPGCFWWPE